MLATVKARQVGDWFTSSDEGISRTSNAMTSARALCQEALVVFPLSYEDVMFCCEFERKTVHWALAAILSIYPKWFARAYHNDGYLAYFRQGTLVHEIYYQLFRSTWDVPLTGRNNNPEKAQTVEYKDIRANFLRHCIPQEWGEARNILEGIAKTPESELVNEMRPNTNVISSLRPGRSVWPCALQLILDTFQDAVDKNPNASGEVVLEVLRRKGCFVKLGLDDLLCDIERLSSTGFAW